MTTALIAGASVGIGAAFADRFAADGYDLVMVARDAVRLDAAAADYRRRYGVQVEALAADLGNPEDRARVEQRLSDPERPVDVLVNNAAVRGRGTFHEIPVADLQAEIDLNVNSVLRLTRAALPDMIGRGTGLVINVASIEGFLPPAGSAYGATKAWIIALTDTLAASLAGTGVKIIVTCPSYVRTDWHLRTGRKVGSARSPLWCDPEDVVSRCLADVRRGRVISAPRAVHRALIALLELPRRTLRRTARLLGRGR